MPGTADWRVREVAGDANLAGFADVTSTSAGHRVVLRVTATAPSFRVTAYRLGWHAGTGGREIWRSPDLPGWVQPKPLLAPGNMISAADWTPSADLDTTGWPPGSYLLKLTDSQNRQKAIPLVI